MGLYPKAINDFISLAGIPRGKYSKIFLVDSIYGSDSNSGLTFGSPLATIAAAFAKCTANHHDTVLVISGAAGNVLSAKLDWSKDNTHLIGMCAPTQVGQRARIFQLSTLTSASPLLTVSASGCILKNLYIFQGVADATSLIDVSITGGRNYFENVHFAGGGNALHAIDNGASLKLDGAEENTFVDCTIGVDTVEAANGFVGILFAGAAHRNIFKGCHVSLLAGHTGAAFVEVADTTGIDRYTIFENCLFTNTNKANFEIASGFVIPAIAANRPARFILKDCVGYGLAKWDANDRGVVMGNMDAITGADLSGVAKEIIS